jgi:hypothetical protein
MPREKQAPITRSELLSIALGMLFFGIFLGMALTCVHFDLSVARATVGQTILFYGSVMLGVAGAVLVIIGTSDTRGVRPSTRA